MNSIMKNFHLGTLIVLITLSAKQLSAQAILDGFMNKQGQATAVLSYSSESYDEFKFGTDIRDVPPPVGGKITTSSWNLFGVYGIVDNLNVIVNLPHITAKGDGSTDTRSQEVSGLQDIIVYLKYRPVKVELGGGELSLVGALGFTTPLSDYDANDLLSIGNASTTGEVKVLTQYKFKNGLFGNVQAGYSVRNNNTPDATILSAKIGYAGAKFYVDACLRSQISDSSAPDLERPAVVVPFNEYRTNFTQLGINAYYPINQLIGVTASAFDFISGRNVGLSTGFSAGVVLNVGG